jgi:hypothetical protein
VPRGDPEHAGAAGADQQARAASAPRQHVEVQAVDLVPGAQVMHRLAGQESPDDGERLLEPVDAPARAVERDARRAVLGLVPAGPDAELEAAAGQMVQARRLVRHDRGMAEVVGEHHRAHVQALGHRGSGRQRAERGQLLAERARREVITDKQGTDPRVLDAARVIGPRRAVQDGLAHHPEPDLHGHVLPSR